MPLPKLIGELPGLDVPAPQFRFVLQDRSNSDLESLRGKVVILCSVPSLDTGTCATETRTFNKRISGIGATVLIASMDLHYAMKRFCVTEGIENVSTGSDFRFRDMYENWGVGISEGPLAGLLARAVWVIDKQGVIRYQELVSEVGNEPDYDRALEAAKKLV